MPIKKNRPRPTGLPGIVQDGPKRFLVSKWFTDPRTGKRRKKERVVTSLAEAVTVREQLSGNEPTKRPSRQRFADFVESWLKENKGRLALSTGERYTTAFAHAMVAFGQYYLDALEVRGLRSWHRRMATNNATSTANGWLRVLRVALDDPVADGILARNPARMVKTLPEGRTRGKRGTALTLKQFRQVLVTIPEMAARKDISRDVARMLRTVAWTGMRRGELLEIRWTDIEDGELKVERAVYRRRGKSTKTDDPRRVTIVGPLEEVFTEQRQWLLKNQHPGLASGLIFPATPQHARAGATRRGVEELSWYRSASVLDAPLAKVVEAAGVPPISTQSFRRTWENLLRQAGVDLLVRRALAGWRTEKAQGIYATVDREERDQASAAVVDFVLGGEK